MAKRIMRIVFTMDAHLASQCISASKKPKNEPSLSQLNATLLCVTDFFQKPPHRVDEKFLPIHARKRITHFAKQNRQLIVLQIPSDFGIVFEAVIVGDEYPCFVSGVAATIYD